jgi:hypothetical protein
MYTSLLTALRTAFRRVNGRPENPSPPVGEAKLGLIITKSLITLALVRFENVKTAEKFARVKRIFDGMTI